MKNVKRNEIPLCGSKWKMLNRFRLVVVYAFFLIMISGRSLIAQQNNSIPLSENYLDDIRIFYEMVLEDDSTNYDALTNLGVIYQQKGDLEKSLSFFEKAVTFHPQKARTYHNLGILSSIIGRLDDAIINLNKAAELDSTNPNSVRQLGVIYMQNEMFGEAIKAFERALTRNNYDTESHLGKTLAYWSLKEYDLVLAGINEMQSLGLRFSRMELLLADVYFKKKDYDKAKKYAKLDETKYSSKAEGHYLLGVLYELEGENDKAKFEFEKAFRIARQNPYSSLTLDINIFFESNSKQQYE